MSVIRSLVNVTPPGCIQMYVGTTDPETWFICDGRFVSKTGFNRLYNVIGNTFGDTSTDFAIPDLRNLFVRGFDPNSGRTFGDVQQDAFASHNHSNSNLSTDSAGSHNHGGSTNSTSSAGSHSHSYNDTYMFLGNTNASKPPDASTVGTSDGNNYAGMDAPDNDNNTYYYIPRTTGSDGSHDHSFTISSDGSHSHSISGSRTPVRAKPVPSTCA